MELELLTKQKRNSYPRLTKYLDMVYQKQENELTVFVLNRYLIGYNDKYALKAKRMTFSVALPKIYTSEIEKHIPYKEHNCHDLADLAKKLDKCKAYHWNNYPNHFFMLFSNPTDISTTDDDLHRNYSRIENHCDYFFDHDKVSLFYCMGEQLGYVSTPKKLGVLLYKHIKELIKVGFFDEGVDSWEIMMVCKRKLYINFSYKYLYKILANLTFKRQILKVVTQKDNILYFKNL